MDIKRYGEPVYVKNMESNIHFLAIFISVNIKFQTELLELLLYRLVGKELNDKQKKLLKLVEEE